VTPATSALHALLGRVRGAAEVAPGLGVVGLVGLLFVPVGPGTVDVLLAASLGIAATVLLAALLAPDALRLSAFPALLLLTTLLRLALSVASTRLVLTRGEAGRVVEALGRLAMQGSFVAGAVVYAILALVQLLVVSRGAERVAEVAARFSLDALPGKQMAIDAELRAGAIDAAEAGRRRRQLEQESSLHGAMDGALKFVKGDAIAGIAIAVVNAGGGLVAGVLRGMSPGAAARRYVLLAVGDGLSSQIPALLLAVAAGIAVTRAAGEERSVSSRVARELVSEPRALVVAAALLGALAVAPGLPAPPFLALAAALAAAAWAVRRGAPGGDPGGPADRARPPPAGPPVEIEIHAGLLEPAAAWRDVLAGAGEAVARDLWLSLGVALPAVRVAPAGLPRGEWRVLLDGAPAAVGRVPSGRALCLATPEELRLAGLPAGPARHPFTGGAASTVPVADRERAAALAEVLDPGRWALAEAHAALRRRAHLLVGVQEAQALLDGLEASAPALVREAARHVPPPVLAETLRRLLEEGVSIRPARSILQAIVSAPAGTPPPALAEACRRALGRHIAHPLVRGTVLEALLLDPATELALREALRGEAGALAPETVRAFLEGLAASLAAAPRTRVLLAPGDVRRPLRDIVSQRFPGLAVLAYEELPDDLPVRPLGRAGLPE
jgi:type III secretion protein V